MEIERRRGTQFREREKEKQREREREMTLKVYADRNSEPSRAVIIFCKANGIDFEEVTVDFIKGQHRSPDFREINPMRRLPAIVHGTFPLFESHAILRYLACTIPGVPDHWYPSDHVKRAKINSILDWHHSNLRLGAADLVRATLLGPALHGLPVNIQMASGAEKILISSLWKIESLWLKGDTNFLLGNLKPSIADLSLACEVAQLQLLDEKDRERLLGPHKKILRWIENVKDTTSPHFEAVHSILDKTKPLLHSMKDDKFPSKL